jgi:hypothetical protein
MVVPGNASGGMEGVAVKPLTVGFHETQFLGKLNQENGLGFWFQLDDQARQQAGEPWGPSNPQALNRYAYVLNNSLKYTDPSGHSVYLTHAQAHDYAETLRTVGSILQMHIPLGAAVTAAAKNAAYEAILSYVAARAAQGAITSLLGAALMSIVGAALLPGALIDAGLIGGKLKQFASMIQKWNGSDGVIIASECGILTCDVTVIDRDSGNGQVWEAPRIVFGIVLGDKKYRPGRAYDQNGRLLSRNLWRRDNPPVYLPLAGR